MSKHSYSEAMKLATACVTVKYAKGPTREQDQYQWAINGRMPISKLVGFIVRVENELQFRDPEPCDEVALVITQSPDGELEWFTDKTIPVDELVGSLEMLKATLINSQLAALMATKKEQPTGLIDPTGRPITRRPQ